MPLSETLTPRSPGSALETPSHVTWHQIFKEAIRDCHQLCQELDLPARLAEETSSSTEDFPLFVPRPYLRRIRRGDPRDPLLLQVWPRREEQAPFPGGSADPVGDGAASLRPGLIHKYPGRALIVATGTCAVHCRYCFRRQFPYGSVPRTLEQWRPALNDIAADTSLREIILSGGDPLTLRDGLLAGLGEELASIPHVQMLRVHTRVPIMIPQRVTSELLDWLGGSRLRTVMVLHANHARELDDEVGSALARLSRAGVMLLNQAVLLREINDSVSALRDLSLRLVDLGVVPYYLHQLDRIHGAAHFEVDIGRGRQLVEELRARLPGYAVPRYVQEIPGQSSKTLLL